MFHPEDLSVFPMNPRFCIKSCPFFQRVHHSPENRMSANQAAKRDVVVSKDALLKSYRKRLKVRIIKRRDQRSRRFAQNECTSKGSVDRRRTSF